MLITFQRPLFCTMTQLAFATSPLINSFTVIIDFPHLSLHQSCVKAAPLAYLVLLLELGGFTCPTTTTRGIELFPAGPKGKPSFVKQQQSVHRFSSLCSGTKRPRIVRGSQERRSNCWGRSVRSVVPQRTPCPIKRYPNARY